MDNEEAEDKSSFRCMWDLESGAHFMLEVSKEGKLTKAAKIVYDGIAKHNEEYMRTQDMDQAESAKRAKGSMLNWNMAKKVVAAQNKQRPVHQTVHLEGGIYILMEGKDDEELQDNIRKCFKPQEPQTSSTQTLKEPPSTK